eukprot:1186598-Prorocentrum_minimum.AAC.5
MTRGLFLESPNLKQCNSVKTCRWLENAPARRETYTHQLAMHKPLHQVRLLSLHRKTAIAQQRLEFSDWHLLEFLLAFLLHRHQESNEHHPYSISDRQDVIRLSLPGTGDSVKNYVIVLPGRTRPTVHKTRCASERTYAIQTGMRTICLAESGAAVFPPHCTVTLRSLTKSPLTPRNCLEVCVRLPIV